MISEKSTILTNTGFYMDDHQALKTRFLDNALPFIVLDGWHNSIFAKTEHKLKLEPHWGQILFPGQVNDLIDFFHQSIDEAMLKALQHYNLPEMKIRNRVFTVLKLRLEVLLPYRHALRRLIGFYSLPHNICLGTKALWRTADHIWYLCGDQTTDFNHYSKRAILAMVYSSSLYKLLDDYSPGNAHTWQFLQQRIDDALAIGKLKSKVKSLPFVRLF